MVNERTIRRWLKKIHSGDLHLENLTRGLPESKVVDEEWKAVMEGNPSQTERELVAKFDFGIPVTLVHLKQTGKVKMLDRYVPCKLRKQ